MFKAVNLNPHATNKIMNKRPCTLSILIIFLFSAFIGNAQGRKKESSSVGKTSSMKKFEGYFNFFYDTKQDKIFLLIDKLDEEFLYVNSLAAGIGSNDIGLDRGQLGGEKVVKFLRIGPKVLLVQPNYTYRAESENSNERQAVEQAFAQSVPTERQWR